MSDNALPQRPKIWAILLKIGIFSVISLLIIALISYLTIHYTPDFAIQAWFEKTRLVWLLWRLGLYALIAILVWKIRRYTAISLQMGRMMVFALLLALLLIEGLNWLYLLG
ncbi:hypothetical protein A1D23_08405 [Chelonobacter oris]|uniref:hemophilus-specific protein n=1 Tax=Chelonobacter oris TaxID=505317 RepID=UPI002448BB5D|nr:hemophilus-specific protein [Chelonobacter oris]MDH3000202.1 hypothetical protein [Chelonobacter oris]